MPTIRNAHRFSPIRGDLHPGPRGAFLNAVPAALVAPVWQESTQTGRRANTAHHLQSGNGLPHLQEEVRVGQVVATDESDGEIRNPVAIDVARDKGLVCILPGAKLT